ncbi:uncharacterized protein MICPUCDRAFT_70267 [Micromonas pusilla CCMP1545]|uniref:Predicted protein n=1 Tax=Micromonas pusilla (strain CCMP1545) TaxID=564608 RepID=C1MKK9_MICPC|nr:uncharacterized protein MICPUCDRAFT_70267 [Micromonas pusilla CCMP1545]EEH59390.1 predicted protein [Micromonas pusilla CCMP1545]|mmetsp:Transcript_53293/g.128274  ORF Transcript_53293/g.128274 Transcript_53293/m.128274 type:complete len:175 (-) Transcript_53293:837-1361(-)|eukprot:XP_003056014.1 predicted protein [Micromonas pusilla CCMP1545]
MLLIFRSAAPILGHASVALSCYNRLQSRNSDVQKPLFCSYSEKSQLHTDSVTPSYAERKHSKKLFNRLLYRAKQRGFLELDILVGKWAQRHLINRSEEFMASFSEVLDEENPELFKWLTGQEYPPSRLANNLAFISLQVHVITIMNQKSHRGARAEAGHSWLRGWSDGTTKQLL